MLQAGAALAQTDHQPIREMITEMYEQYAEESEDYADAETYTDDLMQLYEQPVNLNNCTREDLQKIVFLSDTQIEELLYYVYKRGKMTDLYELQLVEGLDMTDIRRILPFVRIGESNPENEKTSINDLLKYGKHEIYTQFDRTIEAKSGYFPDSKTGIVDYAGNAWHHSLKYRYRYRDQWLLSFTAEKDAGELSNRYDSYGVSLLKQGKGLLKTLILGDYNVSFGQGLLLNQGFRRGKQADTGNTFARNQGFKRFASVNEYNFFRGVAVSLQKNAFLLDVFSSFRNLDADTSGGVFSSVYKTGYHRTTSETIKKHTIHQWVNGLHLKFKHPHFETGLNMYHSSFHLPLVLTGYPYQYFQFSGREQVGVSMYYRTVYHIFQLFGELATSGRDALAAIQGCAFSPVDAVEMTCIYRNYAPQYNGLFASSFGEGSKVANEEGLYLGTTWQPAYGWKLNFYADYYRFPWLRFNADAPTYGKDFSLGFQYQVHPDFQISGRWKTEESTQTFHTYADVLEQPGSVHKTSLKCKSDYRKGEFDFSNGLDISFTESQGIKATGFALYQGLEYESDDGKYRVGGRLIFFDAENYANRMYIYEDDILHSFSVPMLSGRGNRFYVNAQWKLPGERIGFWIKYALTRYSDDRTEVSSGNEMIDGNTKSDIRLLMRIKLNK